MGSVGRQLWCFVPVLSKLCVTVVRLGEDAMKPEVMIAFDAILPVNIGSSQPFKRDVAVLGGRQKPSRQHSVGTGAVESKKAAGNREPYPLVEWSQAISRAV